MRGVPGQIGVDEMLSHDTSVFGAGTGPLEHGLYEPLQDIRSYEFHDINPPPTG